MVPEAHAVAVDAAERGTAGIVAPTGHFHYHVGTRRKDEGKPRAGLHPWCSTRREQAMCDQMVFHRSDAMDM
jgi:hypothetical protein